MILHSWSQLLRLARGARTNFACAKAVTSQEKRNSAACATTGTCSCSFGLHVQPLCMWSCFAHAAFASLIDCTCNIFFLHVQCSHPKRLHVQLGLDCTCSSAMFRSKTIARAVGIGLHMQELCSVCTSKLHELLLHVQNLACCSFSLFLPLPEWNSLEKNLYVPKKCLPEKGEEIFYTSVKIYLGRGTTR